MRLQQEFEQLKASQQRIPEKQEEVDESPAEDIYEEVKRLNRKIAVSEKRILESEKRATETAKKLIDEERKALARYKLKTDYPDFDKIVTPEIADKLVQQNPRLAEMLARIPEEERLPMIYETIQMAGLHKSQESTKPSAQEQINKNLRNTFYTPATAGHGNAPMGDFSEAGKKNAYAQMRELLRRPLPSR